MALIKFIGWNIYATRPAVRLIEGALAPHTSGCSELGGFWSGRCYWLSMQMPRRFTRPGVPITPRAIHPVVRLATSTDSNLAHGSSPRLYGLRRVPRRGPGGAKRTGVEGTSGERG
ncbi:hypothetical protein E2C01_071816 [Portunus trituberculatus]|uniref:Uncharacterized protein n=1 Tax=Portunus trituberculatus TaxID=210409 RepID=A0A5B7I9G4_PORTR|nr:hypothetical protein [Portunus trituberculatus]